MIAQTRELACTKKVLPKPKYDEVALIMNDAHEIAVTM